MSKQFCRAGHDKTVVGVDTQGTCRECRRASFRKYERKRWSDPEKRERVLTIRALAKADGRTSRASRNSRIKRVFGLSPADYDRMFLMQGGLCAICGKPETATRLGKRFLLSVDHDHATGNVRGLLCHNCNHILGKSGDSPSLLFTAARYLLEYQHAQITLEKFVQEPPY